jgi:hypothetical protein
MVSRILWDIRSDSTLQAELTAYGNRAEALDRIEATVRERLAKTESQQRSQAGASGKAEALGSQGLVARAAAYLDDLFNHPYVKRPLSTSLASGRARIHARYSLFFSDVFVYLKGRGNKTQGPGPIVRHVLTALAGTSEPIVVITHSMGGNIFYDVATHFEPQRDIAAWMSVGGQVALFEYNRLFLESAPGRFTGQKVPKPSKVEHWLNVYDPVDPLAFLAEPMFHEVQDFEFDTGSSIHRAHSDYFLRESFYERAGSRLAELIRGNPR